jgi:hypothetical protein
MRKKILAVSLLLAAVSGISWMSISESNISNYHLNTSEIYPDGRAAIAAQTGAPGETTCADCHGASLKAGGVESTLSIKDSLNNAITEYEPNHTYNLTFSYTVAGKKGFQIVGLSDANTQAGTFTAGTGSKINNLNSRQYLNHSSASNSSWTFKWKAPVKSTGKVTFYVSAGNLSSIYTSNYKLTEKVTNGGGSAGLIENENAFAFKTFYANDMLNLQFTAPMEGNAFVNVINMEGKSVAYNKLGAVTTSKSDIKIPFQLENGTYIVQLFVNNYFATKKIVVNN